MRDGTDSEPGDARAGDGPLARLRAFCTMLPEVAEIDGLGRPTFRVATRGFAVYEEIAGRPSVTVKLAVEHQATVLAEQAGAMAEAETGHHGWTVLDVGALGWPVVDELVVASYRLVAPPEFVAQLDALLAGREAALDAQPVGWSSVGAPEGDEPLLVTCDIDGIGAGAWTPEGWGEPAPGESDGPLPADPVAVAPVVDEGGVVGGPGRFPTRPLPGPPDAVAPDGCEVRVLLAGPGASVAHFRLAAGATSVPCRHRTISEVWYVISGSGEVWRRAPSGVEEVVPVEAGTALRVDAGIAVQFRARGPVPLDILGVTMPPWPGSGTGEVELVDEGRWLPTVPPGPLPG